MHVIRSNTTPRKPRLAPASALLAAIFAVALFFSGLLPHSAAAAMSGNAASEEAKSEKVSEAKAKTKYATPSPLDDRLNRAKRNGAKQTMGWLQSIRLLPHKVRLTAKLDTGAKSSVMHAVDIKLLNKKGKKWVRFTVPEEKKKKGLVKMHFELPVVDKSRVKQHHSEKLDERYVVELDFCIAGRVYNAEFSLDDRSKFNYPVLLGRDFLENYFVVDPASTFVAKYNCLPKKKTKAASQGS